MALQVFLLASYTLFKEIGIVLPLSFNRKISKRIKKERRHREGERDQLGGESKTPALGCPGPRAAPEH